MQLDLQRRDAIKTMRRRTRSHVYGINETKAESKSITNTLMRDQTNAKVNEANWHLLNANDTGGARECAEPFAPRIHQNGRSAPI
jgi:hypothetical protein